MLEQSPLVISLCVIWGEAQLPGQRGDLGTAVVVEGLLSGCASKGLYMCVCAALRVSTSV